MYNLPPQFSDLSPRRQRQIAEYVVKERQDAALNAVIVGIKTLNEVYGFGLERLARLASVWQKDIQEFYADRDIREPQLQKWISDIGFIWEGGKLQTYRSKLTGKAVKWQEYDKMADND